MNIRLTLLAVTLSFCTISFNVKADGHWTGKLKSVSVSGVEKSDDCSIIILERKNRLLIDGEDCPILDEHYVKNFDLRDGKIFFYQRNQSQEVEVGRYNNSRYDISYSTDVYQLNISYFFSESNKKLFVNKFELNAKVPARSFSVSGALELDDNSASTTEEFQGSWKGKLNYTIFRNQQSKEGVEEADLRIDRFKNYIYFDDVSNSFSMYEFITRLEVLDNGTLNYGTWGHAGNYEAGSCTIDLSKRNSISIRKFSLKNDNEISTFYYETGSYSDYRSEGSLFLQ